MLRGPSGYGACMDFGRLMTTTDPTMVIVTTASGDDRSGCLVGFSTQCSIDPPRFVVFVSNKNHTYRVGAKAETFAVHFLDAAKPAHDELAALFGGETGDEVDKFEKCQWHDVAGAPVLDACDRWFVGHVVDRFEPGDHQGVVLEPVEVVAGDSPTDELSYQDAKDIDPGHEP